MQIQESIQKLLEVLKCQRCLQATTLAVYKSVLGQLADWLSAEHYVESTEALDTLFAKHVERFWLDATEMSQSARNLRQSVTKRWISYLQKHGIVKSKGLGLFTRVPHQEPGQGKLADKSETITLADGLDDLQSCLQALLSCGLRIAEIQDVNCGNFSADFSELRVAGKGNKNRVISIGTESVKAIKNYIYTQQIQDYFFSLTIPELRKITRTLSIEQALPHDYRRNCATVAYRNGGDIGDIQKNLGHDSANTTAIYLGKDTCRERMMKDYKLAHPRA